MITLQNAAHAVHHQEADRGASWVSAAWHRLGTCSAQDPRELQSVTANRTRLNAPQSEGTIQEAPLGRRNAGVKAPSQGCVLILAGTGLRTHCGGLRLPWGMNVPLPLGGSCLLRTCSGYCAGPLACSFQHKLGWLSQSDNPCLSFPAHLFPLVCTLSASGHRILFLFS